MARRGERFYVCPDCGRRGVRFKIAPHQEDSYYCRYCDYSAFTLSHDEVDRVNLGRLRSANTERRDDI